MNITRENTGEMTSEIKISITEDDYKPNVDKAIKEYQKKAAIKGFRPGKVPSSLIHKLYGKSILAEEVHKLLSDSLTNYITNKKIDILGQPLPSNEKNNKIDFENQKEFDFYFEIGLSPDFTLDISDKIELPYNEIEVEDSTIEKEITYLQKRFGNFTKPEIAGEKDIVAGNFQQLADDGNPLENGITNKANIAIENTKNNVIKTRLQGGKIGDRFVFTSEEIFADENEAVFHLKIKKEDIPDIKSPFSFTIDEITRIESAELNEEFYKKVYPNDNIETTEAFREKVKADIAATFMLDSDELLNNDIVDYFLDNVKFNLPEEFLKRWFKANNEKLTDETLEKEYSHSVHHIRWDLIENRIVKENNIEVKHEEVKEYAKSHARNQLLNYGFPFERITDEYLETFSAEMLKKEDTVRRYYDNISGVKVMDFIKSKIKLVNNKVTFDEFLKLKNKHKEHNH